MGYARWGIGACAAGCVAMMETTPASVQTSLIAWTKGAGWNYISDWLGNSHGKVFFDFLPWLFLAILLSSIFWPLFKRCWRKLMKVQAQPGSDFEVKAKEIVVKLVAEYEKANPPALGAPTVWINQKLKEMGCGFSVGLNSIPQTSIAPSAISSVGSVGTKISNAKITSPHGVQAINLDGSVNSSIDNIDITYHTK